MRRANLPCLPAFLALALFACDSDDAAEVGEHPTDALATDPDALAVDADVEPLVCPAVACGGDPTGSWAWSDWCAEPEVEPIPGFDCDGAVRVQTIEPRGTLDLNDDGTYAVDATTVISDRAEVPAGCLGRASCGGLQTSLNEDDGGWTCAVANDGCTCTRERESDSSERGTWSIADAVITVERTAPDAGEPRRLEFCVDATLAFADEGRAGPVFVFGPR